MGFDISIAESKWWIDGPNHHLNSSGPPQMNIEDMIQMDLLEISPALFLPCVSDCSGIHSFLFLSQLFVFFLNCSKLKNGCKQAMTEARREEY